MGSSNYDCKFQNEDEKKNYLNEKEMHDYNTNDKNVCSAFHYAKNLGVDEKNKFSNENEISFTSRKDDNGTSKNENYCKDPRCNNVVFQKEKNKKNFLHELCKKYVKLSLYRPRCIILSVIIGYLIIIIMSISFYNSIFDDTNNMTSLMDSFSKKTNVKEYVKMNVTKASDVVIHTSDNIGNNVEHFLKFYKKEKAASLLFYVDKKEDGNMLQYDILKDIFFLLQFFKQISIGNNKNWSDMCKKYDIPFIGSKCFVLGLFTVSELLNAEYDTTPNWELYFNDLLNKNDKSLGNFFYNALIFLPNFLYHPHKFNHGRVKVKDVINDISKNVEAFLFVFNLDENVDDSALNEWYRMLNKYVKLINERKETYVTIHNLDNTTFIHNLNKDRNWHIAVINENIVEENEQTSIIIGFKSNFVFAILSFLFIVIYVYSISSDVLKPSGKVGGEGRRRFLLIIAVYSLTFFSFFSTFFIYLLFRICILRIYLLNFFPLFFLSFLFCCVNVYYRNKCVLKNSQIIMQKMKNIKNLKNQSVDMTKYYIQASYKSLYFVGKVSLIIVTIHIVGFICTYKIVNTFSLNSIFTIIFLFFYYTIFFNNIFGYLFYKNRNLLLSSSLLALPLSSPSSSSSSHLPNDQSDQHVIAFSNEIKWKELDPVKVLGQNNCNSQCNGDINSISISKHGINQSIANTNPEMEKNTCCSHECLSQKNYNRVMDMHTRNFIHQCENGRIMENEEICRKSGKLCDGRAHKKGFLFFFVFFVFFFLGLFICLFIKNENMQFNIYSYMNKTSRLRIFIENFEKKAGFVIEPGYLILPSSSDFDYEDEENTDIIIKLIDDMKREGYIHEPIVSWIHAFKLLKNDCSNISSFSEQYDVDRYKKHCHDITLQKQSKELYFDKLKEIFEIDTEKTCNSFYKIVYEWLMHGEDGIYDSQSFKIKTVFQDQISQILPQYYNITPHLFYQDFLKMDEKYNITSSRIGFVLHNYASNQGKNFSNLNGIKNMVKKSNIKNIYFYSESYTLYNQVLNFLLEYKVMLTFYFLIYLFSLYMFNTMGVVIAFQFWLCYNLSVLYFMNTFSINTDAITIILLNMATAISLSHYLYSTLFFKSIMLDKMNLANNMVQSYPYLVFLLLYLVSFNMEDYVSNVLRFLILNHIVWFILYNLTIFCVHKICVKRR
ncbi:hypothetical protein, conserved [Plasmodium gonderi]|uniref:SSD domain-containing protein n=1 Tax=Plasmodium gonderi TaxID=77519 RepID=A0A1Y1JLX1_PLAGO|nr:hypothetical protein, conserved [Plasmodium gonderi]GAW82628.1 hypothetical protein, conserved [Plasmodium gonderi]